MASFTLASEYVTDTMGLVLCVEHRKMGAKAKTIFANAESGNATIHIPAMVFAEILYLSERGKIDTSLREVGDYLKKFPSHKEYPMNVTVVQTASEITDIPELHDRLIAATARLLNIDLISNDPEIQASKFVTTVW